MTKVIDTGRPTLDVYFSRMAVLVATRSTCLRRAVGCVLVDARGHVLATGYNGVAAGAPHCNEAVVEYDRYKSSNSEFTQPGPPIPDSPEWSGVWHPVLETARVAHPHACPGASLPSGVGLDLCEAVHAEQNALLQCRDAYAIHTCYVTAFPCVPCAKMLLGTTCERIVYGETYPGGADLLWHRAGRESVPINLEKETA